MWTAKYKWIIGIIGIFGELTSLLWNWKVCARSSPFPYCSEVFGAFSKLGTRRHKMLTYFVRSLLLCSSVCYYGKDQERRCLVQPPAQGSFKVTQVAWHFIHLGLYALHGHRLGKLAWLSSEWRNFSSYSVSSCMSCSLSPCSVALWRAWLSSWYPPHCTWEAAVRQPQNLPISLVIKSSFPRLSPQVKCSSLGHLCGSCWTTQFDSVSLVSPVNPFA